LVPILEGEQELSDIDENSVNGEDFKEVVNSLRFLEQIDRLRNEIKLVRASSHGEKKLLIQELQRDIENLIELNQKIELDEKQEEEEEEVSAEPGFLISNQAKYGTRGYADLHPEERMSKDASQERRQDYDKLNKLSDKVTNDYLEIKKIKDLINSGELINDKDIETAIDKLEHDKEKFEKFFEYMDPILFKEFKIDLLRARDKRLGNASTTSRDEISNQIEELQQDIVHIKEVYEKDSEKSRAGIDEELEEESVEIDAAETIEHMIDEAEFKKENEEN